MGSAKRSGQHFNRKPKFRLPITVFWLLYAVGDYDISWGSIEGIERRLRILLLLEPTT